MAASTFVSIQFIKAPEAYIAVNSLPNELQSLIADFVAPCVCSLRRIDRHWNENIIEPLIALTAARRCACRTNVSEFALKKKYQPFRKAWALDGRWTPDALVKAFEETSSAHQLGDSESLAAPAEPITHLTVRLRDFSDLGALSFAKCAPFLPELQSLTLANNDINDANFRCIAESGMLSKLTHLNVSGNFLTAKSASLLESMKTPLPLTSLNISNNQLGLAGAQALAKTTCLPDLQSLNLSCTGFDDQAIAELALNPSPTLFTTNLTSLSLDAVAFDSERIGSSGAAYIANCPHLSNLRKLSLNVNAIGTEGVKAIAASPILRNLESLSLDMNELGNEGFTQFIQAFTAVSHDKMTSLSFRLNEITSAGLESFKLLSSCCPRLTSICFGQNEIGPEGLAMIIGSPSFASNLKSLVLDQCSIGCAGVEAIASSQHLTELQTLNVSTNYFGPLGLQALFSASAQLPRLRHLNIRGGSFSPSGIQCIYTSPLLQQLESLEFSAYEVGMAGMKAIHAASPKCRTKAT